VGIAEAFLFATRHPERYAGLLGPDGSLTGPGFSPQDAARLPERLRAVPGMVTSLSPAAVTEPLA
jgi:hypothetical protein